MDAHCKISVVFFKHPVLHCFWIVRLIIRKICSIGDLTRTVFSKVATKNRTFQHYSELRAKWLAHFYLSFP